MKQRIIFLFLLAVSCVNDSSMQEKVNQLTFEEKTQQFVINYIKEGTDDPRSFELVNITVKPLTKIEYSTHPILAELYASYLMDSLREKRKEPIWDQHQYEQAQIYKSKIDSLSQYPETQVLVYECEIKYRTKNVFGSLVLKKESILISHKLEVLYRHSIKDLSYFPAECFTYVLPKLIV